MTSQNRNRLVGGLMGAAGVGLVCLALADYLRQPDVNGIYLSIAVIIVVMAVQYYRGEGWESGKWLHVTFALLMTLKITLGWIVKERSDTAGRWMILFILGFGILLVTAILELMHRRSLKRSYSSGGGESK